MALFGNLFQGKRKKTKDIDDLKKDKRLIPFVHVIMAMREGDEGEIVAALARPMECWKCGREFPVGKFIQPADEFIRELTGQKNKKWGLMTKCPNPDCNAEPILCVPNDNE